MKEHRPADGRDRETGSAVIYRDERRTLCLSDGLPCLTVDGVKYCLSCHPFEPCLYITDENGLKTVVRNAFDPVVVSERFLAGGTVVSASGHEYDAKDFCRMVEYAAGKEEIIIDDAERVFGDGKREPVPVKKEDGTGRASVALPCADAGQITEDARAAEVLADYPTVAIDYRLVKNDHTAAGADAHRRALAGACKDLFADREDMFESSNVGAAEARQIDASALFAYPKSKRGENYRGAFLYPPNGGWLTNKAFDRVNAALFPCGTDKLEVFEWTTDWSEYFDDGHEWWGALCYTVYDKALDRFVVIIASATD